MIVVARYDRRESGDGRYDVDVDPGEEGSGISV